MQAAARKKEQAAIRKEQAAKRAAEAAVQGSSEGAPPPKKSRPSPFLPAASSNATGVSGGGGAGGTEGCGWWLFTNPTTKLPSNWPSSGKHVCAEDDTCTLVAHLYGLDPQVLVHLNKLEGHIPGSKHLTKAVKLKEKTYLILPLPHQTMATIDDEYKREKKLSQKNFATTGPHSVAGAPTAASPSANRALTVDSEPALTKKSGGWQRDDDDSNDETPLAAKLSAVSARRVAGGAADGGHSSSSSETSGDPGSASEGGGSSGSDSDSASESEKEPEYTLGEALISRDGSRTLKVQHGSRKGAVLYESISTAVCQYSVGDDCYIEGEGEAKFVGKIVAIGKGASRGDEGYVGDHFVMVYWYYQRDELDPLLLRQYRKKGVKLVESNKCVFASFHPDMIDPSALRKRITVYYSMAEPQDPNKHLQENELCCSYVFDPDGVTADGHSTGMLHSLADTVYPWLCVCAFPSFRASGWSRACMRARVYS